MQITNIKYLYRFLSNTSVTPNHHQDDVYLYRGTYPFKIDTPHPEAPGLRVTTAVPYTRECYDYSISAGKWRKNGKFSKPLVLKRIIDIIYYNEVPDFDWSIYAPSFPKFLEYLKTTWIEEIQKLCDDKSITYTARGDRLQPLNAQDKYDLVSTPRFSKITINGLNPRIAEDLDMVSVIFRNLLEFGIEKDPVFEKQIAEISKHKSSTRVIETPEMLNITLEQAKDLLSRSRVDGYLVASIPSLSELMHPNEEAIKALNKQMEDIPGFQITYMRLREECLYSAKTHRFYIVRDAINGTPDGKSANKSFISRDGKWKMVDDSSSNEAILYAGPAWALKFKIKDLKTGKLFDGLSDNIIHMVTGQMWTDTISKYRPDLLKEWQPDPDTFYFLASEWCLRTDGYWYERGALDYFSLQRTRLAMKDWLITHFVSKCHSNRKEIPNGIGGRVLIDGMRDGARLKTVTDFLKNKAVVVK